MSRFLSQQFASLTPYTPGEQPRDQQYVKLNTNESPFPPSPGVLRAVAEESAQLNLYCDPECTLLRQAAAELYGVEPKNVLPVNGSDEALYFTFLAFGDKTHPFAYPEISYGFYPVFAKLTHVPAREIPLKCGFTVDYEDYLGIKEHIVIANPNAPTGVCLSVSEIEQIVRANPDRVVVIDEAYIDFGGESCVPLVNKYDNLLVIQTFSKSRSLAGARLGFAVGNEELIRDLNTIKYSVNPYNVNRMTQAAGVAAIQDGAYYAANAQTIIRTRERAAKALEQLGFTVLPSKANFLFAVSGAVDGETLYRELKARGVLVRHFTKPSIQNYCRITIGTDEQMDILLSRIQEILREKGS
ncbi:Histidinol-phosphate aminotransferase [bioreactor metagenome]|uniref:Histidinol-phosphate aminotransferase n=1 Tax=bioreactor metagenome TaxID=1076179 RepID=A0A644WBP3_9ZZZZ